MDSENDMDTENDLKISTFCGFSLIYLDDFLDLISSK